MNECEMQIFMRPSQQQQQQQASPTSSSAGSGRGGSDSKPHKHRRNHHHHLSNQTLLKCQNMSAELDLRILNAAAAAAATKTPSLRTTTLNGGDGTRCRSPSVQSAADHQSKGLTASSPKRASVNASCGGSSISSSTSSKNNIPLPLVVAAASTMGSYAGARMDYPPAASSSSASSLSSNENNANSTNHNNNNSENNGGSNNNNNNNNKSNSNSPPTTNGSNGGGTTTKINGGRLQFFKDGKFILELASSRETENGRTGWVAVPQKIFWPPTALGFNSYNNSSASSGTTVASIGNSNAGVIASGNANHASNHNSNTNSSLILLKNESSASLSFSDDNSSIQSSPSWQPQRDHCWKKLVPRANISRELCFVYVRPKHHIQITSHGRRISYMKRRRPFDQRWPSSVSKDTFQVVVQCGKGGAGRTRSQDDCESSTIEGTLSDAKTDLKVHKDRIDTELVTEKEGTAVNVKMDVDYGDCNAVAERQDDRTNEAISVGMISTDDVDGGEGKSRKAFKDESMDEDRKCESAVLPDGGTGKAINTATSKQTSESIAVDKLSQTVKDSRTAEDNDEAMSDADAKDAAMKKLPAKVTATAEKKKTGGQKRRRHMNEIVSCLEANRMKLMTKLKTCSALPKVDALVQSHLATQHVSPRKRILRELERVSLDENNGYPSSSVGGTAFPATAMKRHRAKMHNSNGVAHRTGSSNSSNNHNNQHPSTSSSVQSNTFFVPSTITTNYLFSVNSSRDQQNSGSSSSSSNSNNNINNNKTTSGGVSNGTTSSPSKLSSSSHQNHLHQKDGGNSITAPISRPLAVLNSNNNSNNNKSSSTTNSNGNSKTSKAVSSYSIISLLARDSESNSASTPTCSSSQQQQPPPPHSATVADHHKSLPPKKKLSPPPLLSAASVCGSSAGPGIPTRAWSPRVISSPSHISGGNNMVRNLSSSSASSPIHNTSTIESPMSAINYNLMRSPELSPSPEHHASHASGGGALLTGRYKASHLGSGSERTRESFSSSTSFHPYFGLTNRGSPSETMSTSSDSGPVAFSNNNNNSRYRSSPQQPYLREAQNNSNSSPNLRYSPVTVVEGSRRSIIAAPSAPPSALLPLSLAYHHPMMGAHHLLERMTVEELELFKSKEDQLRHQIELERYAKTLYGAHLGGLSASSHHAGFDLTDHQAAAQLLRPSLMSSLHQSYLMYPPTSNGMSGPSPSNGGGGQAAPPSTSVASSSGASLHSSVPSSHYQHYAAAAAAAAAAMYRTNPLWPYAAAAAGELPPPALVTMPQLATTTAASLFPAPPPASHTTAPMGRLSQSFLQSHHHPHHHQYPHHHHLGGSGGGTLMVASPYGGMSQMSLPPPNLKYSRDMMVVDEHKDDSDVPLNLSKH